MKKTKKRILSAITSVLLVSTMLACTVLSASATAWPSGTMNDTAKLNSKRANAYGIQTILYRLGTSPKISSLSDVDGYFGDDTLSAVKTYQRSKNLTPDGIVGTDTWGALSDELTMTSMRNILRNSDSADIGVYDTYKVIGGSPTTDCFFGNIGVDYNSRYCGKWLTDNRYSGRGTSGSYKLSAEAMVMNSRYTVDAYPAQ